MLTKKNILLMLLLIMATTLLKAQTRAARDTSGGALAQKIAVPADRAKMIQAVLNYRHDDIIKLMRDRATPPQKKHEMLLKLLKEREALIAKETTPEERQKLQAYLAPAEAAFQQKAKQQRAANDAAIQKRAAKGQ